MKPNFSLSLILTWTLAGAGITASASETNQTKTPLAGAIDARMLRYPAVSSTQIAFVYAGDIWIAPKTGGEALRLSSPKGEESFPRFSPDGTQLAFSGNYDGNTDVYVAPVTGGLPRRLTFHGAPDRVIEWYPDGKSILFASSRTSEKDRFNQLYKISANGGLPEKLPLPYGEFGSISPDGKTLAYTPISVDFRTWKRYRGGMNPAIWLFNLETFAAKNITGNDGTARLSTCSRIATKINAPTFGRTTRRRKSSARSPRSKISMSISRASARTTWCLKMAGAFTC
jgi:Tol biopolymer transport system component